MFVIEEDASKDGQTGKPWTNREVELVVRTYLYMLRAQESGNSVNKSECNRRLALSIPARNLFSISRKHSNISAVLTLMGIQTLAGYKPLFNYQHSLFETVERLIKIDREFDSVATSRVQMPMQAPTVGFGSITLVPPPRFSDLDKEKQGKLPTECGIHRDYLARESANRSIGFAGELAVLEFEKNRLANEGAVELASLVDHVSVSKGDGLGFDILSFNADGTERHIEVKTTAYGIHTPIYVSRNEAEYSAKHAENYWLYRVFDIRRKPKIFTLKGDISINFSLTAMQYIAHLNPRTGSI
ncbi:DUF3883 domain-containing protein [Stenotrophomonas sp. 59]|uniref:DUF3883 domain-containing protein n=1 Tax=Stenotrophomonas sp. 59 TaxID=3051120 RepID=UPI00256EED54|nr:DUF3883 domain-containing protein [Stenotrophomonas sp. 59]